MPRSPQWSPSLRFPHQDPIHPLSSPIRDIPYMTKISISRGVLYEWVSCIFSYQFTNSLRSRLPDDKAISVLRCHRNLILRFRRGWGTHRKWEAQGHALAFRHYMNSVAGTIWSSILSFMLFINVIPLLKSDLSRICQADSFIRSKIRSTNLLLLFPENSLAFLCLVRITSSLLSLLHCRHRKGNDSIYPPIPQLLYLWRPQTFRSFSIYDVHRHSAASLSMTSTDIPQLIYLWRPQITLHRGFSVLFLSFKANVRAWLAKTGHGPHSSQLDDNFNVFSSSLILVWQRWVRIPESLQQNLLIVSFCVLFV